jgi:cysteine-S-conjugate beta-lyase
MKHNFDAPVDRRGSWSEKWDMHYPGWPEALPMWVADMDFQAPPEVTAALAQRLAHGVYGYTYVPESALEAAVNWRKARCGHEIKPEWVTFSSGVVCSLKAALDAFTEPGDGIVVQTPTYPPFMAIAARDGRRLVRNPLLCGGDGRWHMDYEGLEDCFRNGAKLMFLCSSHNPVGRVWSAEELSVLAELCIRYDVIVASDEIHCDIIRPGNKHTALAALPGMQDRTITLVSSTKTFNLAGLQNSVAITADPMKKKALEKALYRSNHNTPNLFGMIAQEAAWAHGEIWLEEANAYIAANCDLALELLSQQDTILTTKPEGTYLLWLDCRKLGMKEEQLQQFFTQQCHVWPTMGKAFEAEGFIRLNLATRRSLVQEGIGRILEGVRAYNLK